ncbi:unnamed protein product [Nezara viridula]|uniref:JmjC domain-containing histone demethylation protein 2C n=1 Tax=Nezara viridula TaxID=85310 RepID=A0A9P0HAC8_NEZVI|nr:unnamed protein product [Nezara viridula]
MAVCLIPVITSESVGVYHNPGIYRTINDMLLVEYDDREWVRREWVQPHKGGAFQVFLVERTLIWCSRAESPRSPSSSLGPALTFTTLVGELPSGQEAVEFIRDRHLAFRDPTTFKTVQDVDRRCREDQAVRDWIRCQDGQGILLTTPSILVGYRVQVYRVEGTTQWYTAVIVGYNPATGVTCPRRLAGCPSPPGSSCYRKILQSRCPLAFQGTNSDRRYGIGGPQRRSLPGTDEAYWRWR